MDDAIKKAAQERLKDPNVPEAEKRQIEAALRADQNSSGKKNSDQSGDSWFTQLLQASTAESTYAPSTQSYGLADMQKAYKEAKAKNKDGDKEASVLKNMATAIGSMVENSVTDYIKEQEYLLNRVNGELGLSGELSEDFRETITNSIPELAKIGVEFDELVKGAEQLVESTGRFALVGTDMLVRAGEVAQAYGMDMSDVIESYASFEKVGIGAAQANEAIADAGKRSLEVGIQSKNTIKGIQDNIEKLNQYGFENGVEGLEKMVRRATEVRMSLNTVFNVADKVFDPEGALDLAANLQVLGGAFGEFNDPLRLMYMATNEVEGLQGAIEGVAQNLATYNVETGGFEVTGANLRMARDIAKQFGVEVSEINNIAIATQERMAAATSLAGLDIDEEQVEYLTNIARMKDGKMQIELLTPELQKQFNGATSVALENLDSATADILLKYQDDLKPKDEKDLIRDQVGMVKNIDRNLNYLSQLARIEAGKVGDTLFTEIFQEDFKSMGQNVSEFVSKGADEVGEYIKKGSEWTQEVTRNLGEKFKDGNNTPNQSNNTTNVGGTVTVNHNVGSAMGAVEREMFQNPEKWTDGLQLGRRDLLRTSFEMQ